jgi:micrococcal nuclease
LQAHKIVKVWEVDTDRYGRIVGFVFVNDKNLNKELLSAGLAWHYKQYSRDPELARLEFEARSAKRGLWAEPSARWLLGNGEGKRNKRTGPFLAL